MLDDFKKHINTSFSFLENHELLVAVSGGLDSMVLAHLCLQTQLDISIAHCNFGLRGSESDGDAIFVEDFCQKNKIRYFSKDFETGEYAQSNNISTQMAARDLRYEWFEELLVEHKFDYLLTAHHLNDDLETFLINLGRGTGLSGLTGIPKVNGKIVRPLLKFSRKRIYNFARQSHFSWREDQSNASDDYMRNHLRHHAIPSLEEAHPNVYQGFQKTQAHLKQAETLLAVYDQELHEKFTYPINAIQGKPGLAINCTTLSGHATPDAVLYRLLHTYDFTAWEDIYRLRTAQSGKEVVSKSHRLVKNRSILELYPLDEKTPEDYIIYRETKKLSGSFGTLFIDHPASFLVDGSQSVVVMSKLLKFPLTIRKWKPGDYFYPFGLGGKKKLSKYFKDEKVSLIEKENVWVLCNKREIVWVINYRADDRYKITDATQEMTRFTLVYETENS